MAAIDKVKSTLKRDLPECVDVQDVVQTEMVLAVLEQVAPDGDAAKAYLVLHNYSLLGHVSCSTQSAFLQKAHICLRQCSSKQKWNDLLTQYREKVPAHIRIYTLSEEGTKQKPFLKLTRNNQVAIEPNRVEVYIDEILHYHVKSHTNYAKEGMYSFWLGDENCQYAKVNIPLHSPKMHKRPVPKKKREAIVVTMEDLHMAASEMKQIDPDDYCESALKANAIKAVIDKQVMTAIELSICNAVNMVGMVGAGKSTLMKVLSYHLAKQQKQVVLVVDTVADALHLYAYFRKLKINAAPLIGRSEREKYIYQVAQPDSLYLKPEYSEYLTASCIVTGMAETDNSTPHFGKEPCLNLKKDGKRFTCPYVDICPSAKLYRDILTANVIVTTVQGLAATRLPGENRLFLENVLEQADLVVFDECDKVQKTLDEFFTPATEFTSFMNDSAQDCADDMKKGTEQLDSMGLNARHYSELRLESFSKLLRVREMIESFPKQDEWNQILQNTFSAMTLLRRLREDSENPKHPLPEKALSLLEDAMDEPDDELSVILDYAIERKHDEKCNRYLVKWLENHCCKSDESLIRHIKLYLIITQFDKYVQSLEDAYSYLTEDEKNDMELFNFLQARFTAQQKLLPSAAMGNLFGLRNEKKKGLQLYRQYAFGRALMTRMPWLRMTEEGHPAGPHVLLLSGSSWAAGCLEYHVHVPVKYLLEAEEWKREKLAQTSIIDLCTCVRVSGCRTEEREAHLQQVIYKSMDPIEAELQNDGKLLMIVNSYAEARIAAQYLNSQLQNERAAFMMRSSDQSENNKTAVLRGEIGSFDKHPARILVAPAQAIERGYNIVNEKGHSTFGSVFFLVRPMAIPDEIASKSAKLNGIIDNLFYDKEYPNAYAKSEAIRQEATKQWHMLEHQSRKSLRYLNETMRTDVTAGLFVLILQIFGRLARITEKGKPAPRIYFADGAFRTAPDSPDGYDCLNELRSYLAKMMQDDECGEIAKTLYAPFYEAFERGVNENVYTDYSDGDEAEDEYTF